MTAKLLYTVLLLVTAMSTHAQQVNDTNTPLHLMKPQYKTGYGVVTPQEVKQKMDMVLHYLEKATPCTLEDQRSGKTVQPQQADMHTRLRPGDFRTTEN